MTVSKSWFLLSIPAGLFTSASLTLYNLILGDEILNDAIGGFIGIFVIFLLIAIISKK